MELPGGGAVLTGRRGSPPIPHPSPPSLQVEEAPLPDQTPLPPFHSKRLPSHTTALPPVLTVGVSGNEILCEIEPGGPKPGGPEPGGPEPGGPEPGGPELGGTEPGGPEPGGPEPGGPEPGGPEPGGPEPGGPEGETEGGGGLEGASRPAPPHRGFNYTPRFNRASPTHLLAEIVRT